MTKKFASSSLPPPQVVCKINIGTRSSPVFSFQIVTSLKSSGLHTPSPSKEKSLQKIRHNWYFVALDLSAKIKDDINLQTNRVEGLIKFQWPLKPNKNTHTEFVKNSHLTKLSTSAFGFLAIKTKSKTSTAIMISFIEWAAITKAI